jgi:tetratricopeptide (TPR) repeat protein
VHGHARTLALLAPSLRARGVDATRESLVALMTDMDQRFPGSRERSVFASVELSLRRLSPENQQRARALGVFHGSADLDVLAGMMEWDEADAAALAAELVQTGLATPNPYNHISLNPALCPYLRAQLDAAEHDTLTKRWVAAMFGYVEFLGQQLHQSAELAATLTGLELANLFALLGWAHSAGDAETTINLSTSLYSLLQKLGKPRLLSRLAQVRDAVDVLSDASDHATFQAAWTRIEQQLDDGQFGKALLNAHALLQRTREAGEQAYPAADYDLAAACFLLARALQMSGGAEQALPLLAEARQRFDVVEQERPGCGAARMASVCLTEQGDCLRDLGRYDAAAIAYEASIRDAEHRKDERSIAVGKGQLGTVRLQQNRHVEAFAAFEEARERFTALDEPSTVAGIWHQTGMAYVAAGQADSAEDAYRKSLAIKVRLDDIAGQASTLGQLGNLYSNELGRMEEAVAFYRQAAEKYVEVGNIAGEGRQAANLGATLLRLGRLEEARHEIRRAIECDTHFGHAVEPWKTRAILAEIEIKDGNAVAATEAKGQAVAAYLAYRRDGGESQTGSGFLSHTITQFMRAGDAVSAESLLLQLAEDPKAAHLLAFISALRAIVAGSRDRSLAANPDLDYGMAAEVLLLIETLEQAGL